MRDEKEERKKQARSNKQTRQSNTAHVHVLMRDEKERSKQGQTNKHKAKQHSTPKAVNMYRARCSGSSLVYKPVVPKVCMLYCTDEALALLKLG